MTFKDIFLKEWRRVPEGEFERQIQYFLEQKTDWLTQHPDVRNDPEIGASPMGIHQTTAPLMPYRRCALNGQVIFLFEEDIRNLLS